MAVFQTITHHVDFCVVGGGIAGMLAAISAARHGVQVVLMGDRPVLGGNASSEIRMWICGAAQHGDNNRETGILEEIMMESLHRNPTKNYSIWDSILFEKVKQEKNITLLLNCSCMDATMAGTHIQSVTGWQLTTQQYHTVTASIFADCSGDSILAPLTGAAYRIGREGKEEFGETIAPDTADRRTMGLTCMIQGRETPYPVPFTPPTWAEKFTTESLAPYRLPREMIGQMRENFWYLELGGMHDSIADTETLRDELLGIAFGMWDYVKKHCDDMECWELDWVGFLPGKRESRRYVGAYTLTEQDILSQGKFEDLVAYGGWTMDDHHPAGFRAEEPPNIFHPAPCPYGIPYRVLYAKDIDNLMFAGRNISATHAALSSTRVMATCGVMGQAVGTAVSIAVREGVLPKDITTHHMKELQQTLMRDDCYLPFHQYDLPALTKKATLTADSAGAEVVRNGYNRKIGEADNGYTCEKGGFLRYTFDEPTAISTVRIVFDSDLNRETLLDLDGKPSRETLSNYPLKRAMATTPKTMTKSFAVQVMQGDDWQTIYETDCNYQRLLTLPCNVKTTAVQLKLLDTHGNDRCHVFCFDVE